MAATGADLGPLVHRLTLQAALSGAEQAAILDLPARITTLKSRGRIYRHGDVGPHCTVLLSGHACRYTLLPDGGRQILSLPLPGDIIDIDRLAVDRMDHSAEMLTPGRVAIVPLPAVATLTATHPGIARALWRVTMAEAAIQREWTVNVGRRNAHARIAHLLCELGVRHEALGLGGRAGFAWIMTQSELGDCAGLTSVHVNRVMRSLREAGLIDADKRQLAITDWSGLAALGGFDEAYLRTPPRPGTTPPAHWAPSPLFTIC